MWFKLATAALGIGALIAGALLPEVKTELVGTGMLLIGTSIKHPADWTRKEPADAA